LIAELKRRHVLKVGAAYLVVAWIAVQVASIAFPTFEAPAWVLRVFILIAMLGFPIAVVMAWMLELTPDGMKVEPAPIGNKRVFGIAAAFVALAVTWYFVGQPALRPLDAKRLAEAGDTTTTPGSESIPKPPSPRSIAVLPFVNMSADKDNEFFSDGISEELLNALVRVDGLQVASRTSSFAYKGSPLGAAAIAREMNVAHILEGSVRKSGATVRITAQLIDTANDRHVWSQTFDRKLDDIFAVQDEIAKAVVDALRGKLEGPAPAALVQADTENMQAYELYLEARAQFLKRQDLPGALRKFERVVAMDPNFARGYEGVAMTATILPGWGYFDRDYRTVAVEAADKALALDPSLSSPWAVKGWAVQYGWPGDFERGLEYRDKAIAADPRNATAYLWRGVSWFYLGFFDKAIADFRECLRLDPAYDNCHNHLAAALVTRGDEKAGLTALEGNLERAIPVSRAEHFVGPLVANGDRRAALAMLALLDVAPELRKPIVDTLADPSGKPHPQARALIERYGRTDRSPDTASLGQAPLYLWLGVPEGITGLDDSKRDTIIAWERHPASFRNSAPMKARLVASGVVAYWRKRGFPPQCHPVGADDFRCD